MEFDSDTPARVQAALTSAVIFSIGAAAPLALVLISPPPYLIPIVSVRSLFFLAVLGLLGARTGGDTTRHFCLTAGIRAIIGTVVLTQHTFGTCADVVAFCGEAFEKESNFYVLFKREGLGQSDV